MRFPPFARKARAKDGAPGYLIQSIGCTTVKPQWYTLYSTPIFPVFRGQHLAKEAHQWA
jgi:hypothetical protein